MLDVSVAMQGIEWDAEEVCCQWYAHCAGPVPLQQPHCEPKVGNPGSVLHWQPLCQQQASTWLM